MPSASGSDAPSSGPGEAKQRRRGTCRRAPGVRRGVDGDEGARPAHGGPCDKRVRHDLRPAGHDDELRHAADRAPRGDQLVQRRARRRLSGGQHVERKLPVRPDAADMLEHRFGGRDDEQHLPRAQGMGADEPGRRTDGVVEARGAARTRDRPGVDVEDDRDALARCILELPHHQLAAPCGRRPMHCAEGLSLDVFPDAVGLEPARATNERPPAAVAPCARVGEERVELRHPRADGHERVRLPLDHGTAETERVARDQASPVEPVAPARHCVERDVCAAIAGDRCRPRPQRAEALLPDERAAEPKAAVHLGLDRERLSLDRRAVERPALDRHSLHDEPPPGLDRDRCEREADPHQRERRGTDQPRAGEDTGGKRTRAG